MLQTEIEDGRKGARGVLITLMAEHDFEPSFEMAWENNYLFGTCFYPEVFSPEECERIIATPGKTNTSPLAEEIVHGQRIRNSESTYLYSTPENEWIYQRLLGLLQRVNQESFHFHIDSFSPLQRLKYTEGGHYNWHVDLGFKELSNRKLSLVAFLSDPQTFKGGRLKMITGVQKRDELPQAQGTVVIFPSYVLHQVQPVLEGTRYSLVLWAHGPCFQ